MKHEKLIEMLFHMIYIYMLMIWKSAIMRYTGGIQLAQGWPNPVPS